MIEGTLKTLHKMTRTKLIEEAHKYPEIEGAHGLAKEQLVEAIAAAMKAAGEFVEEPHAEKPAGVRKAKKPKADKGALKKLARELKKKRDEAAASGDATAFARARARLHRVKGRLRRTKVAEAG